MWLISTSLSGVCPDCCVVSVTLNSGLGGLQHKSGGFGEELNLLSLRGIVPVFLGRLACSLATVPCVLSPLTLKRKYIYSELNCGYLSWLPNLIWDPGQEVLLRLDRTSCHKQYRFWFVLWIWLSGTAVWKSTITTVFLWLSSIYLDKFRSVIWKIRPYRFLPPVFIH
jgi:hypothetical protein